MFSHHVHKQLHRAGLHVYGWDIDIILHATIPRGMGNSLGLETQGIPLLCLGIKLHLSLKERKTK